MANQNVRVISFGNGKMTAQVVVLTGSEGNKTSRTMHLHLLQGYKSTYGSKPDTKGVRALTIDLG